MLGRPRHSAGHDVASFWYVDNGICYRQYAWKIDSDLFTIAQGGKIDEADA